MKVLLLTTVYPPEVRSSAQIMYELAQALKELGHEVVVMTAMDEDGNAKGLRRFVKVEMSEGIKVIRVSTLPIHKAKLPTVVRGVGQLLNAFVYSMIGLFSERFDVTLAYSPPITLGLVGIFLKKLKGIPHVLNVQDLVPQYAIDLGLITNPTLIKVLRGIEGFIYRNVSYISVHSDGNKSYIESTGIEPERVVVVPNWVDTDLVAPAPKMNDYRKLNGLEDKFIVLFAGILGYAQDLDTVVEAGAYLENEEIVLLIVGEGVEKERLERLTEERGLKNVKFMPFVPKEEYPEVVAAADLCLAPLKKDLKCPVIPSKILGYMSGARPVITALDLEGDAPHVIREAQCGLCVEPGEPKLLAQAIDSVFENKGEAEKWGANGREYILKNHKISTCVGRYDSLFAKAAKPSGAHRAR